MTDKAVNLHGDVTDIPLFHYSNCKRSALSSIVEVDMPFWRPKEKDFKMIWEVEKNNKKSYLVGTAHFFPYSFKKTLRRYLNSARIALFEGPLDEENMAKVVNAGHDSQNSNHLCDRSS